MRTPKNRIYETLERILRPKKESKFLQQKIEEKKHLT